jgi:teichuronic acid biosynthesis glycosyltransferase TuaH
VSSDREGFGLVWLAGVAWDGVRGTDWHLATAMSRHARILWVDPPVSPVTSLHSRGRSGVSWRPRLSEVADRISRLTTVALPGHSRPGVRGTTAALVRGQVRRALRRAASRPEAVVATSLEDLLGYWGDDVVDVLYGTDDYVAGAKLMGLSADYLRRQERRALDRADVVAAVSPVLAQRWAGLGARPLVIPNGCLLRGPGAQEVPASIPDLPRPVAGLVGQFTDRIDLGIVESVAAAGISLLIVGPIDPRVDQHRVRELTSAPNVHYAGMVSAEQVPGYLAAIDVGLTPYGDTRFNQASFPLKTLEYLGAGVPVISTDLPAARWLREDLLRSDYGGAADQVLALAADGTGFVAAINRMRPSFGQNEGRGRGSASDELTAGECRGFAARHTWSRRSDELADAIGLSGRSVPEPEAFGVEA